MARPRWIARLGAAVVMLAPAGALVAAWPWLLSRVAEMRSPQGQLLAAARHPLPPPGPQDREAGRFALCDGPVRVTCVVDGDTIWYRGTKIRVADINAPETHDPTCAYEGELGERATRRLTEMLNAGRFSLVASEDRDEDAYGRKLRTIMRGGESLGEELVHEGLAERWVGFRRNWC